MVWLVLAPILAVVVALAAGAMPTRALAGRAGLIAMGVACGMSALATILGSVPVIWAAFRSPQKVPTLALAATLLRVIVLAAMAAPVAVFAGLHLRALLLWVGISYVVALGAESLALVLLIRRMEPHR